MPIISRGPRLLAVRYSLLHFNKRLDGPLQSPRTPVGNRSQYHADVRWSHGCIVDWIGKLIRSLEEYLSTLKKYTAMSSFDPVTLKYLTLAVELEKNTNKFYETACDKVTDPDMKSLLASLMGEGDWPSGKYRPSQGPLRCKADNAG